MSTSPYRATIGLEVHVELSTTTKMFCGCPNAPHDSEPNTNVCPICLAHPGTLPVPNEQAIASILRFGHAVGAQRATYSEFDRKHYFYPDIPKAYQLSQYAFPFLTGGVLGGVALTRVHLEEDTARSQHDKGEFSVVDFNRAGVPLMELVTEPVIHDAATAGQFARELQLILRTLKIATAHMERGEMRVEANVSVSAQEGVLGNKVEVKNLNSFKSVEAAIAYEIERQQKVLSEGGEVIQETRGWDENRQRTFVQRTKETAKDYRYFPDPDIPKMRVDQHEAFSRLNDKSLLMPEKKRSKYKDIGLPSNVIEIIISHDVLDAYYADFVRVAVTTEAPGGVLVRGAHYLVSDVIPLLEERAPLRLPPELFLELMVLLEEGVVTSRAAKDLLPELIDSTTSPRALVLARGLTRSSDESALRPLVMSVMSDFPDTVAEYRAGKVAVLQYLLGQAMKRSQGTADPAALRALFMSELDGSSNQEV
jgi:aspartyl-tRNA(Asn)/glutamyl-tRNA(Gln) amidotransferase subunit B